jgi:pimeloyl-ACP methyl ester carboxylesterase
MSAIAIIGFMAAVVLLSLAILYRLSDRETMTAATFRADSGYQLAQLSAGDTAYQVYGPDDGPVVIILHGATLGSMAYRGYVPPLVEAGYRVVMYDQYGRGFSDRPKQPFTLDLLRRQLLDLMDDLSIDKAHLFGISLGGALAARFGAEHGQRVASIAYQVPAVAGANVSLALMLSKTPILGAFLTRLYAVPAIIARGESFGTDTPEARQVVEHFQTQFQVIGTERVMRQLLTGDALSDRMADHQKIGASGIRAQFVYATDDPEIAAADVEKALAFYTEPDVHQYTGGHFFSGAYMDELPAKLDSFFKS